VLAVLLSSLLLIAALPASAAAQVRHEVFLPKTEHELNVYRVSGAEPGKTIMIIGGIQGDEPGSYLTADLYADIHLRKGNLIVVPRANLYSILLNSRNGATGDMNRKFDNESTKSTHLEEEIVSILKHLIAESDCLLNLHEGSGFYAPTWISDQENPDKFGQSIIYDAENYEIPGKKQPIHLGQLAQRVVEQVNQSIPEPRYQFRANNHNTISDESSHKEQRKSATFYALTREHIPAFGVETSKEIDSLETKIRLHKLVINTFMAELGIVLDAPGVSLEKPQLNYLLLKVNSNNPVALPNGATLNVTPGDEITVTDIIANYPRGLIADIENFGTKNDTNIPFRVTRTTRIIVRKDAEECGQIVLVPQPQDGATRLQEAAVPIEKLRAEQLLINVDDQIVALAAGQTIKIAKGKRLILQGVRTNIPEMDEKVIVNFKGFAPPKKTNKGNDLHLPIYTDQDLWTRYSKNKQGRLYPIVVSHQNKTIGEFWVEIDTP